MCFILMQLSGDQFRFEIFNLCFNFVLFFFFKKLKLFSSDSDRIMFKCEHYSSNVFCLGHDFVPF